MVGQGLQEGSGGECVFPGTACPFGRVSTSWRRVVPVAAAQRERASRP